MAGTNKQYKFTKKDTDDIVLLGYSFHGVDRDAFDTFMQQHYSGFNLAHLLKQIEQLMVSNTLLSIIRRIGVDANTLQIRLENDFNSEDDALIFDRIFYKEKGILKVKHEFLVLPIEARNHGLSKKILKASLEQYLKMGIDTIEVVAGLSKGAYVWARHGFVAVNPLEMKRILNSARQQLTEEQFNIVEKIYNHYYTKSPQGEGFPISRWANLPFMKDVLMRKESQWHGRLNLKNKEQLRKFEYYVSE